MSLDNKMSISEGEYGIFDGRLFAERIGPDVGVVLHKPEIPLRGLAVVRYTGHLGEPEEEYRLRTLEPQKESARTLLTRLLGEYRHEDTRAIIAGTPVTQEEGNNAMLRYIEEYLHLQGIPITGIDLYPGDKEEVHTLTVVSHPPRTHIQSYDSRGNIAPIRKQTNRTYEHTKE